MNHILFVITCIFSMQNGIKSLKNESPRIAEQYIQDVINSLKNNNKEIVKRSDGLMHALVNLLVAEKLERGKMWRKMKNMDQKMKAILKELSERNDKLNTSSLNEEIAETKKLFSNKLKSEVNGLNNRFNALKYSTVVRSGAVYIRWGRTSCPSQDTKLIYSGYAAGGAYNTGGGTNPQCLPKDPNWRKYQDSWNSAGRIYGAEYQTSSYLIGELLHKKHHDYDVPCAVCQSKKRSQVYMIPAKDRCYRGWHLEYRGYLMSPHPSHATSEYACVDANPTTIGSKSDQNGRLFYPTEAVCGSLKCPPYVSGRELTCAVCTF